MRDWELWRLWFTVIPSPEQFAVIDPDSDDCIAGVLAKSGQA